MPCSSIRITADRFWFPETGGCITQTPRRAILVTESSGFTANKRRTVESAFLPPFFSFFFQPTYLRLARPPWHRIHSRRNAATTCQAIQVSKTCLQPADSSLQTQLFPQLFTNIDHAQRPYSVRSAAADVRARLASHSTSALYLDLTLVWVLGEASGHEPLLGYDRGRDTVVAPAPHPYAVGHTPAVHPPWPLPSFFATRSTAVTATPQCHAEHPAPPLATRVRKKWEEAS